MIHNSFSSYALNLRGFINDTGCRKAPYSSPSSFTFSESDSLLLRNESIFSSSFNCHSRRIGKLPLLNLRNDLCSSIPFGVPYFVPGEVLTLCSFESKCSSSPFPSNRISLTLSSKFIREAEVGLYSLTASAFDWSKLVGETAWSKGLSSSSLL